MISQFLNKIKGVINNPFIEAIRSGGSRSFTIDIPQPTPQQLMANVSHYNPFDPRQTRKAGDGIMASGKKAYKGAVATNDRRIPLGTKVEIDGQIYTIEDHMNKRFNNDPIMFDIANLESKESALKFGRKSLPYRIMK